MTHWYREPKRVKLLEHLERAGVDFVFNSDEFAESDLRNLKSTLQSSRLADRFTLGTSMSGDVRKVLIIAPRTYPDPACVQNPEPWAGIFVLPARRPQREHALRTLFAINCSFNNGARGRRAISKGILHRFVLDMRVHPPSLYGLRESFDHQRV